MDLGCCNVSHVTVDSGDSCGILLPLLDQLSPKPLDADAG